jgi:DNA-binding NarL/FixJ family response regulator
LLSGEAREYSIDKRYLAKDGRYLGANSRVSLVRDPSGEPSYFISVIEDINEREGAELALRSLTAREMEILVVLARGRTNREISRAPYVSERTAKFRVRNIMEKLSAEDRRRAADLGLPDEG